MLLGGYNGILQYDGYGAYKTLAAADGGITLAFCWSHVRREFIDLAKGKTVPIAAETLQRIAALYAVEVELRGKPPDLRRTGRQQRGPPPSRICSPGSRRNWHACPAAAPPRRPSVMR